MKTKTIFTWIAIFAISFIPAILLLLYGPRDFSSSSFVIGQMAGLMGMTMFALTFILSTRAYWVEYLFDGLDKVFAAHGALGATSTVVILLHPILLIAKYLPDRAKLAATYILPGGLWSIDFGIYALLCMIILIVLTLYARIGYHRWKISHEFYGLVFLLASIHVLAIRGNGSRDYIFNGYYWFAGIVVIVGLLGFGYSFFVRRYVRTQSYAVDRITKHTNAWELQLRPKNNGITYKAGQFIFIKFHNDTVGKESHPFSIASASGNGVITIIVKNLGDYTSKLGSLKEGDHATIEGPYGRFHYTKKEEPAFAHEVWIAGGIGITPFLGLAQDFAKQKNIDGTVDLYYAVREEKELLRIKEFEKIASNNPRFKITPWISEKQGYLTLEHIEASSGSSKGKRFYLCGPDSLKQSIKQGLRKRGVYDVHDERFAFK